MKRILIVEDSKEQRKKAKQLLEENNHYYYMAEDLQDAILMLLGKDIERNDFGPRDTISCDGVITDIHFPRITGRIENQGDLYPYGIEVMIVCYQKGIPFVVCTDIDHRCLRWIEDIAKRLGAKGFISGKGSRDHDPEDKVWEKALELLLS